MRRRCCHGLMIVVAILVAHDTHASEKKSFEEWAAAFASQHDGFVQDWWSARLEASDRTDFLARVCSKRDLHHGYYLIQAGNDRWSLEGILEPTRFGPRTVTAGEQIQRIKGCATTQAPREPPPFRSTVETSLLHQAFDSREWEEIAIAIRDGEPRVMVDRGGSYEAGHTTFRQDWERLVEASTRMDANGRVERTYENAITPIVTHSAALPPTWNTNIDGGGAHARSAAAIRLDGTANDRTITLHVNVKDDRIVAGKGGDRFQIVVCDPRSTNSCLRTIDIASEANVFWRASPLDWPAPLPRIVGRARDRFDLELPDVFMRWHDSVGEVAITVIYYDVDAADAPPSAVIATSRFADKDARSLGRIVRRGDGSRYPTVAEPENAALTLKAESTKD